MKSAAFLLFSFVSTVIFGQDTIHQIEYSDGFKSSVQIVSTDGEDAPDFFIGGRLLGTLYAMKNFSTAGTVRASAGFNYIEGNISFGADGFFFPLKWHKIKLNSGVFTIAATPVNYAYQTYAVHLLRLNNLRVVRLLGLHGGHRYKIYPNGELDYENEQGRDLFNFHSVRVNEFSAGIVFSSRRFSELKILKVNSKELGAKKNWTGSAAHWLIWAVYADLVLEQGKFTPEPIPYYNEDDPVGIPMHVPVWDESYNPFPLVAWRVAGDIWYTRRSYSKKGTGFWGFSTHVAVSKTCFSYFSQDGYSFYALLGLTYSRKSKSHAKSDYHAGKIAPDLKRTGGGPDIIVY